MCFQLLTYEFQLFDVLCFIIENERDSNVTKYKSRRVKFHGESSDSEAKDELGDGEFESRELEYFSDTPNSSSNERGFLPQSKPDSAGINNGKSISGKLV